MDGFKNGVINNHPIIAPNGSASPDKDE